MLFCPSMNRVVSLSLSGFASQDGPQDPPLPHGETLNSQKTPRENATSGNSSSEPATSPRGNVEFAQKQQAKMKFLAEALPCAAKYRDPGGGVVLGQSIAVSAPQPASGAHTQRHSLSPRPPPALRHPYVAILPSRRVPDRRPHAVLLCVPAPRIASVRHNPPFPRPVLANRFASAAVSNWGDRGEVDI